MPGSLKNEDELDLSFPSLDGDIEDEQNGVEPNAEPNDIEFINENEKVDLDTSLGFDHQLEDWEIYNFSETEEKESWSSASDIDDSVCDAAADLVPGEENGWLDESEPMEADQWDYDMPLEGGERESEEDSGEEGVEDEPPQQGSDDETTLPPIDPVAENDLEDSEEEDFLGQFVLQEVADPRLIESEDE
ncbi:MAG: hypothetical protein JXA30_18475 [Deltaproteobacteria bacterium]|nr:hypothetical protein [Deltaproteobacteria bacterium]